MVENLAALRVVVKAWMRVGDSAAYLVGQTVVRTAVLLAVPTVGHLDVHWVDHWVAWKAAMKAVEMAAKRAVDLAAY